MISNCCHAPISNPDTAGHGHCSECGDTCSGIPDAYDFIPQDVAQEVTEWINASPCPVRTEERKRWNEGTLKPTALTKLLEKAGWTVVEWDCRRAF